MFFIYPLQKISFSENIYLKSTYYKFFIQMDNDKETKITHDKDN